MEKVKVTKEQLNIFVQAGKHYIQGREQSELTDAVQSLLPVAIKKLKKVERERDSFRISLAKKTASKHLEKDRNGNYQYTEEDTKKIWQRMDEIDQEFINMPCIVIQEFPEDGLTFDIKRGFSGIVIPKLEEIEFPEEEEEEEDQTEE